MAKDKKLVDENEIETNDSELEVGASEEAAPAPAKEAETTATPSSPVGHESDYHGQGGAYVVGEDGVRRKVT